MSDEKGKPCKTDLDVVQVMACRLRRIVDNTRTKGETDCQIEVLLTDVQTHYLWGPE